MSQVKAKPTAEIIRCLKIFLLFSFSYLFCYNVYATLLCTQWKYFSLQHTVKHLRY